MHLYYNIIVRRKQLTISGQAEKGGQNGRNDERRDAKISEPRGRERKF